MLLVKTKNILTNNSQKNTEQNFKQIPIDCMKNHLQIIARTSIWILAGSVFCIWSCVNSIGGEEEEKTGSVVSGDIPIKVSAKTLHSQIYQKNCNEAIGLYVLVSPTPLAEERYIENKQFKCTASGFVTEEEAYYPAEKKKCDFISYYPYQQTGIAIGEQKMDISIRTDQSLLTDYNRSDFMTAQVYNRSAAKKNVELHHTHQLCQLSIRIKPTTGYDTNILKKSNPSIRINQVFTQATYDFDKNEISSAGKAQNIIPNGEWSIDNHTLTGKRCILIPQTIPAGSEILTLTIDSKNYECQLTEDYELESGTACELILRYDPILGINGITASINNWKEGNKSEINPTEKEEKTSIHISDFDFGQSFVHSIMSEGKIVAEVCKEYLSSPEIQAQAIVIYPVKGGVSDWQKGTVLQIIDDDREIHGGKVIWDEKANTLNYKSGNLAPILSFCITQDLSVEFSEPADPLLLSIKKRTLTDIRKEETCIYPIVKIGTQYWMRENLKTTFYNDDKKITAKTPSGYSKSSAGYFKEKTHLFYNKAAVISGKLAPKGWKIADEKAWQLLKSYIKDDGSILKGKGLWGTSEYTASDMTGFSAIPTGIFAQKKEAKSSIYAFAGKYAIYWNMGNDPKTLAEKSIALIHNSNQTAEASHSDFCGYSVRCVMEENQWE